MPYHLAGIDVHKKMLAVVVADVAVDGDYQFEPLKIGTGPAQLRALAEWLVAHDVAEVVMESPAQYWRPVWEALERYWQPRRTHDGAPAHLYLAQAQSNRGVGGRKKDVPDAERLVKRLVAQELTLRCVPDAEQRLWRTVMRRRYQPARHRVQLHNRLEALLEEAHLKLSSLVSDRCPKGNHQMRRVLNQAANAAARAKGTIFAVVYRRLVARLGHAQAIGVIAHRLCRLVWKILHERVRYEERGPAVDAQAARIRTRKMIRALRGLGIASNSPLHAPDDG